MSHLGWLWDNAHTDMTVFGKGLVDDEVVEFCHRTRWHWIAFSYLVFPVAWALLFGGRRTLSAVFCLALVCAISSL